MHLLLETRTKLTLLLVVAVIFYVIYENSRTASISSAPISRHEVDEGGPDILRLVQDEVNRIITDRRAGNEVSEEAWRFWARSSQVLDLFVAVREKCPSGRPTSRVSHPPAQLNPLQQDVNAGDSDSSKDFYAWNPVLPSKLQYSSETDDREVVEPPGLNGANSP
nr:unnamed protein product [Spirometra erinaceieuropaei]